MRFLGFLICLGGLIIGFPAWLQWMNVVLSMRALGPQGFAAAAGPVFANFGLGAVIFGVGFLMIIAFR